MIDELMEEYRQRFDDNFPLMCFMDVPEDKIAKEIRLCLHDDKPFEPIEGVDY